MEPIYGGQLMARRYFQLDGGEAVFEGFDTGQTWNGWRCPMFTKEQADAVVADWNATQGDEVEAHYDQATDTFVFVNHTDENAEERFARSKNGLFAVGAWGWCWNLAAGPASVLADHFTGVLRNWLTPEQWVEVVSRNADEESPNVCHSHDFCDANMAMAEAWENAFGFDPDVADEEVATRWGEAWNLAMASWGGMAPPHGPGQGPHFIVEPGQPDHGPYTFAVATDEGDVLALCRGDEAAHVVAGALNGATYDPGLVKRVARMEDGLREIAESGPDEHPEAEDWGGDTERAEAYGMYVAAYEAAVIARRSLGETEDHVGPSRIARLVRAEAFIRQVAACVTSDESVADGADMASIDESNTMAMDALIVRARDLLGSDAGEAPTARADRYATEARRLSIALRNLLTLVESIDGGEHDDEPVLVNARRVLEGIGPLPLDEKAREAVSSLLAIVEAEYEDDPEPEDLDSWKQAIALGHEVLDA